MHLKIKRIEKVETKYGFDLSIKMISLYDNKGQFVRNVKLNDALIDVLKDSKIVINPNLFKNE